MTESLPAVPRATLGRSGIETTRIGLGTAVWPFKMPYEQVLEMVQTALDCGIRYFDTAALYGTEDILGRALGDLDVPEDTVIATKTCSYRDELGINYMEYSGDTVYGSVERSLKRLQLDRLDIVHIHDVLPEDSERVFSGDGALRALLDLRDQGVVGSIGMATDHLGCLLKAVDSGEFDHLQMYHSYTLLNWEAKKELIPRAREASLSTMNAAPMAGYILASGAVSGALYNYRPASEEVMEAVRRLERFCEEKAVALPDAALALSLNSPDVDVTVIGADTPDLVRQSVAAFGVRLAIEEMKELVAEVGGPFEIEAARPGNPAFAGRWKKPES